VAAVCGQSSATENAATQHLGVLLGTAVLADRSPVLVDLSAPSKTERCPSASRVVWYPADGNETIVTDQ
jgi:hypothetical protein